MSSTDRQDETRPDQTRPGKARQGRARGNCPDRGKLQGSSWQALSNGQTGSVIAVKKEDGRTADRGRKGQTLTCWWWWKCPHSVPTAATNDVEKKVWQPLGFGDKGLSEALKRLKVEGSRPDCRCLRSAGATVAMSRPRLHAQLGFLALGVFSSLPSLQASAASLQSGALSGASAGPAMRTPLLPSFVLCCYHSPH